MKNIILFLLFLAACGSNPLSTIQNIETSCPKVFFASEHNTYVDTKSTLINLDNIAYIAKINNYAFNKGCFNVEGAFNSELSILFVITPHTSEINEIFLPFYVAIINSQNFVLDIQYYNVQGDFNINAETKELVESEITKTITIENQGTDEKNSIIIGFMLDQQKLKILN